MKKWLRDRIRAEWRMFLLARDEHLVEVAHARKQCLAEADVARREYFAEMAKVWRS
jgi:hypothetical protein